MYMDIFARALEFYIVHLYLTSSVSLNKHIIMLMCAYVYVHVFMSWVSVCSCAQVYSECIYVCVSACMLIYLFMYAYIIILCESVCMLIYMFT